MWAHDVIVIFQLRTPAHQSSEANIKRATHENLKDILFFQDQKYIDRFKTFLERGDTGYLAYLKGNCIHRSWVRFGKQTVYPHWAVPYNLKENEVYIHYCETAPEARGQNVYPHVLSEIASSLKDRIVLISANKKNAASIRGIEKAGFIPKEEISVFVIFGIIFRSVKVCDS
jgi:hypothetical protein